MKGMIAIIRKEFARFFLDRRMLITTILMPGLLIYLVYTLMGTFVSGIAGGNAQYTAAVDNMPQSLTAYFQEGPFTVSDADGQAEDFKTMVKDG